MYGSISRYREGQICLLIHKQVGGRVFRPTGSNPKYLPIFDRNLESIIVDSQSEIATAINNTSFSFSLKIEGKTEGTSMLCL
jgi:hypothetical protein